MLEGFPEGLSLVDYTELLEEMAREEDIVVVAVLICDNVIGHRRHVSPFIDEKLELTTDEGGCLEPVQPSIVIEEAGHVLGPRERRKLAVDSYAAAGSELLAEWGDEVESGEDLTILVDLEVCGEALHGAHVLLGRLVSDKHLGLLLMLVGPGSVT